MDPVTLVTLGGIGVGILVIAAPKIFLAVQKGTIKFYDKKRKKKVEPKLNKEQEALKSEGKDYLVNNTVGFSRINFKSIKNNNTMSFTLNEKNTYETDDILLRGTLTSADETGKISKEDIYLFQPKLLAKNDVIVGPKTDNSGNVLNQYTYLIKNPEDNDIMYANIPKREVVTGMQMDNVVTDYNQENVYGKFFKIEIPMSSDGNYIPVNLNDEEERLRFEAYCNVMDKSERINYIKEISETSKKAYDNYQDYLRLKRKLNDIETKTNKQEEYNEEVERRRQQEKEEIQKSYDSYRRYDFWRDPRYIVPGSPVAHATDFIPDDNHPEPHHGPHR